MGGSISEHISETARPNFTELSAHGSYGRGSSIFVQPTFVFVDDVTFPRYGPYVAMSSSLQ